MKLLIDCMNMQADLHLSYLYVFQGFEQIHVSLSSLSL